MSKSRLVAILIALFALSVPATASATSMSEPQQWSFGTNAPMTGTQYQLKNLVNNRVLSYSKRSTNPQLAWAANGTWELLPHNSNYNIRDHRKRPVVSGQKYWLYNSAARKYFGLGADSSGWRRLPVPFTLKVDSTTGATSLKSEWVGDFLIHNPRKSGFTIDWLSNLNHTASVTMTAQPVTQGFVPFLGGFGGGVDFSAVLTEVRNPANGPWLSFVKPGYSTQQCGDPSAVIKIAPGQVMTSLNMRQLYGSPTPSLRQRIPFLACAATNSSSVWVNIRYQDV